MSVPADCPGLALLDWKEIRKGALAGVAAIRLPNGLTINKVMVFIQGSRTWVSLPSEPMVNRDGMVMTDAAGKRRYAPLMSWPDKTTADKFSAAVVAAVKARHPDAFDASEASL